MNFNELKEIDAVEVDPFDIKKLRIYANKFRLLYVMSIVSPDNNMRLDIYLVGGRMYYIDRIKYNQSGEIISLTDFISEAQPFSIVTLFDIRRCFIWGINDEIILYPTGKYEFEVFNYTAKIIYKTDSSTITVYGYSNISDRFAIAKAREFINPLISLSNNINFEIDRGYDPQTDIIPTKLLLDIKKVIG